MTTTRVLVVDDNHDVGQMLTTLLSGQGLTSVGHIASADELEREVAERQPEVVLMDRTMPGRCSIAALKGLSKVGASCRTILMSGHDDPAHVEEALDAGAWGYLCKDEHPGVFVEAIRQVAAGELYLRDRGFRLATRLATE